MRKLCLYLLVDLTVFSLPLAVYSSLPEASSRLGISVETLRSAIKRNGKYSCKKFELIRVHID